MTEIKSKEVILNNDQKTIYNYLIDLTNFKELLPPDKISEWEGEPGRCSFKIQNAATIELLKESVIPHEQIKLKSGDKSPFPFTLTIHILDQDDDKCKAYQNFQGKMNPFLKMMAQKPLSALFDHIADKLKELKG